MQHISEAGVESSFQVVLETEPTAEVRVGISSSDPAKGLADTSELVFDAGNWDISQTVTGVNDCAVDGDVVYRIVTAPALSADPLYDGVDAEDVTLDNDSGDPNARVQVCNYTLVDSQRVSRTHTDFTYQAEVSNHLSGDLASVTARIESESVYTEVIDDEVDFGPVPSGATRPSLDTVTIRQDRRFPFDPARLLWQVRISPN